jgi:hypothetical protein
MDTNYTNKLNEFINQYPGKMILFEVTKCCNYSTFVFMYKDEMLSDLYNRVAHHFESDDIVSLYIISDNGERIKIPFSPLTKIKDYIITNTAVNSRNMKPVYSLPAPVVYRIYINDGHNHNCCNDNITMQI